MNLQPGQHAETAQKRQEQPDPMSDDCRPSPRVLLLTVRDGMHRHTTDCEEGHRDAHKVYNFVYSETHKYISGVLGETVTRTRREPNKYEEEDTCKHRPSSISG